MSQHNLTSLAFHAEKLHDDQVWKRVECVASWMSRRSMRATFFVYPFRAQVVHKDISSRVRRLAALGHEIGQHTHFYAGDKVDKPDKVDDLSDANIARCLSRDFETLENMGFTPRGFTAGGWFVTPALLDALIDLEFHYDCSAQYPKPQKAGNSPYNRWLQSPQIHEKNRRKLLCIPTTCSLGEWFKWGRKLAGRGNLPYKLICTHDYDLLTFSNFLLLWCLLTSTAKRSASSQDLVANIVY